jgi:choline-glycine betaine transporter
MRNLHIGHCVAGAAIALALVLALGVSVDTLGTVVVLAVCPLMMLVMMRGMAHGASRTQDQPPAAPD